MGLTESMAMTPAASVSGFYLAHPDAAYFNVGRIGLDQLADWAQPLRPERRRRQARLGAALELSSIFRALKFNAWVSGPLPPGDSKMTRSTGTCLAVAAGSALMPPHVGPGGGGAWW